MINATFEEAHSREWIKTHILDPTHELVLVRQVIPWQRIIDRLVSFYDTQHGRFGASLRMMVALLIVAKLRQLSDREVVNHVKENRYLQYFCNVPDKGLQTFLHSSVLSKFRTRLGEKGIAVLETEVFERLRQAGVIDGDTSLIDSTVLSNNLIYPNDVQLLYKAFGKMASFAQRHELPLWWDEAHLKQRWRAFGLAKKAERPTYLAEFYLLFAPTRKIFAETMAALSLSEKEQIAARQLSDLLGLLDTQTQQKLAGEQHIKDRIVSLDEVEARPIKKGKSYPSCEFGTTLQMSFNRQGFLITTENFIGKPNDTTLYGDTLDLFRQRLHGDPDTVVTDQGARSQANFIRTPDTIDQVFLGRSEDVAEEHRDFCRRARSATEGFIAVAKHLRGFGRSLYRRLPGDRIWSLLCQTAYNLKKFVQQYRAERLTESSLVALGLLG